MKGDDKVSVLALRHGPVVWGLSLVLGLLAGVGTARLAPPAYGENGAPIIRLWMAAPFVALLASIALMPLLLPRVWHRHFPDFALGLGGLVAGYYLAGFGGAGPGFGKERVVHALVEYYGFMALVGGLYVVSGTILVDYRGGATPLTNTLLLAAGALLANIVSTTGASVLLIRPFLRLNEGRVRPIHVVLFIFIVSNCAGCLLPIGDPPLYLGFLKGVPFLWTLLHLWPDWLATVLPLLVVFYATDSMLRRREMKAPAEIDSCPLPVTPPDATARAGLSIRGGRGLVCLCLMLVGVLIDPLLERLAGISGLPIGATFQVLVACAAYAGAPKEILSANEFSFFPVKEVGLLFAGIFTTMIPALSYLGANGARLGITTPTAYYFGTGVLSAVLDNAPTYLNFLQVAIAPHEMSSDTIRPFLATPGGHLLLRSISTGAVFFGAMTYIGNGPNFMVRSIAESAGIKMPSFFGFIGWAAMILLPVLALHWLVLIR
jgi:Na+/H+ antiporter NhaD/arsenite permease-like protein